ncbi:MAG: ribonuclease J [Bacilli bacterium]
MSKIKFFALGGLAENGKNMFICEVDDRIFILDAGLKYPSVDLYGVDAVIPDISYLIENKDRVQGLFITHGHEDHIGAVPELLKELNIGVYGTHFTISVLEDLLQDNDMKISDYRLYRINEEKIMKFGNVQVHFYYVSHSIPEAVNIAIKTDDGFIVYAPDFTFDVNSDSRYRISFSKIGEIASGGVLALASESIGTSNINRVTSDINMVYAISDALQSPKRVIFSTFSSDLDRIQKIINVSVENNRRIAIIGRKAQKIVNIAMNSGYLKIPDENLVNLRYIDDKNTNDDDDLVVIVTGNRHEPFYMLQRMCRGQDRLIKIKENDKVVTVTPPVPGTERMAARTIDILYKAGAEVIEIKKDLLKSSHASREDLKMLYNMLKPKYIIPVIGEYRHQFTQKQVALESGYSEGKIIILENGEIAEFNDKEYSKSSNRISHGDVLVDGSIVGDINEYVLKDRELLAQEGLVIITIAIDARNKKILSGPEIITKGLVLSEEFTEMLEDFKIDATEVVYNDFKKKYIDWSKLKNDVRDVVSKALYRRMKKRPIIMTNIIDVVENKEER